MKKNPCVAFLSDEILWKVSKNPGETSLIQLPSGVKELHLDNGGRAKNGWEAEKMQVEKLNWIYDNKWQNEIIAKTGFAVKLNQKNKV